ncbi:hypothetical protein [Mucilaginibacter sp. AK015]|uniref:hypothetical protein n=1 Tax=Mucilaginibacter sp. AK015 TaxID=2723072 RepID=UPI00160ADB3F|nr:hypothetical protein [Mucilaginibacter sp. AK015]MBB5395430.1 hypothetical protein [Mucilaginibacter sp. AK015]
MRVKNTLLKSSKVIIILLALCVTCAYSQDKVTSVNKVTAGIDNYYKFYPSEKLSVKLDKPHYFAGDTIWFKTVLINASNRLPSALSNKVYVELLNDSSRLVERLVIPLTNGTGNGNFKLPPQGLTDGAYTIRAYTNWMQNFGEEAFFHKRFYIGDDGKNPWLIKEQHTIKTTPEGKSVALTMQFTDMHNMPLPYKDMQVFLINGGKTVYKQAFLTSDQGDIAANFNLPADVNTRNLKMVVRDGSDKKKTQVFPFYPGATAQSVDVQFMPEGGEIVAGLLNKIAFKAIGDDGLGINISGVVVDGKGAEVATFKSTHNGMGNFRLVPLPNVVYKARINYNGDVKEIPLPAVKASGITLRVDNVTNPSDVKLFVTATPDLAGLSKTYMLIAQGKDSVYLGYAFDLNKGYFNLNIPAGKFATGVISFSILNEAGKPLSERRVFINNNDNLVFKLMPHKIEYQPKDSVAIQIEVLRSDGSPVKNGSFAIAVTDDGQVKLPQYAPTILTGMLLASEIKGYIEEPGWYFNATNANASKALDDLMLTQGWTGFNWDKLAAPIMQPVFRAEMNNDLYGRLINFFKKPVGGAKVTLLSSDKNNLMILDTLSDKEGKFMFPDLPVSDSIAYTIKVHKKNGDAFGGSIMVDEFKPAVAMPVNPHAIMPWFVNTDSTLVRYLKNNTANIKTNAVISAGDVKGQLLDPVTIKAKKILNVKGMDNEDLYYYDVNLEEKDMLKARSKTLLDYLEKDVKGFRTAIGVFKHNGNKVAALIIDGVNAGVFYTPGSPGGYFSYLRGVLTNITAADVKQLVIYHKYLGFLKRGDFYAIIIIKTRGGHGPLTRSTPGIYVYRPLPLYNARQFYKPRYAVDNTYDYSINRSTIHWEPNLITDENGKATLSFYTADKQSTYTLNIEGTDMLGHFGAQTLKIKVDAKPTASK